MKLLILITIFCPIALIYLVPRYIKLREKYIQLQEEVNRLKKLLASKESSQK